LWETQKRGKSLCVTNLTGIKLLAASNRLSLDVEGTNKGNSSSEVKEFHVCKVNGRGGYG
jgi:hypothetical protein